MTRKLTHSAYDHVAMVLTFTDDDDIYLLEATSEGVHVVSWTDMKIFKDRIYSKIVWRKLYSDRNDEFWEILETFVNAVEDRKYNISIGKLLKRKSLMPRKSQVNADNEIVEENRTFFCSELIAKAFKTLGFFISARSCTTIYPKHFSSKRDLGLTNSVLGEELDITFDICDN